MNKPIRIFIVDDHVVLRLGIIKLLGNYPTRFEVVGECAFPDEALPYIQRANPDVVLTGMNFGADRPLGIDLIKELKVHLLGTKCMVLTADTTVDWMYCAYSAGAIGYLSKSSTGEDITRAIELVHRGVLCYPGDFEARQKMYDKVPAIEV